MGRVSVIVVNWNTRELLRRCLESVYATEAWAPGLEVLVVDNASTDGSAEMVASRFPDARLIASPENLGFARANNLAMRQAGADLLLLLNPDAELIGAALPMMLTYADEHPEVAVIGPQLLNQNGTVQSSRRRFPTRSTAFLESTVLQRWFPDHPSLRRYYRLDRADDETQEVDWLVGACLLVRSAVVKQVGGLDESYFMYSEELDWCRRISEAGWKLVYHPLAKVLHHGGQGSGQDHYRRHIAFQHGKCRYFEKYHGHLFAQLLRVFLLGDYLFTLAEDILKLAVLPWKRRMRLHRIGVLARVVAWQMGWVASWGRLKP